MQESWRILHKNENKWEVWVSNDNGKTWILDRYEDRIK